MPKLLGVMKGQNCFFWGGGGGLSLLIWKITHLGLHHKSGGKQQNNSSLIERTT
jgi:hypothetical protein